MALLLHGLSEDESAFDRHRDRLGTTYADTLAELGWTPVLLRANSGLPLRENGVALAALARGPGRGLARAGRAARLPRPLDGRPRDPRRLRGRHGRGRAVDRPADRRDHPRHPPPRRAAGGRGRRGARGRSGACRSPRRSAGSSTSARSGCSTSSTASDDEAPALPHARYHLVSATLSRSPRHPVGCGAGRPAGAPALGVRRVTGPVVQPPRPVPGRRPSCTSREPGTSTCSTTRACTARCATGWPGTTHAPQIRCRRTGAPTRVEASAVTARVADVNDYSPTALPQGARR